MHSETTEALERRYGSRYRWYVTVTAMTGMVSAVITMTTVNVALRDIMGAFGVGQDRAQWLSTGALAAMTVGMLMNAWLVRRLGQRLTFVGSLVLFIASLLVAGASPTMELLILCRVVQGLVAGLLQPLTMFTLFRVFPPEQRGTAMGLFGISTILGPALGPTFGGLLIDLFNWRYVFYLAIPFASLGILGGSLFMPGREEDAARVRFDWAGFILLSVAISTLLIGLSNGQREGWESDFVLGMLALALASGAALVVWQLLCAQPLVELRVLLHGQFTAAAAVAAIFGAGLFGSVYLVPLFVQSIQHFTALEAGLLLMPAGLVLALFMPIGGYMSDRLPARTLVVSGLLCFAASAWFMGAVDANTPFWHMAWWVALSRIGLGLMKPALNLSALRSLGPAQLSQGAGLINFARQLGGAFGVNVLSVVLDRRTAEYSAVLTATQSGANAATAELLARMQHLLAHAGVPPEVQGSTALHYLGRVVHAQAYTLGFRDSFVLVAAVFAVGLVPAWIMGRPGRSLAGGRSGAGA